MNKPQRDYLNPFYEDNFIGCLVGLAVGDALGQSSQNLTRQEVAGKFGILSDFQFPINFPTDNLALTLVYLSGIVDTGGKVDAFDIGPRSLQFFDFTFPQLRSSSLYSSLQKAAEQNSFQLEVVEQSQADNRVLAQSSPVGLLHAYGRFNRERFMQDCEVTARLTHAQSSAVEGATVFAAAVRLLCRDEILPEDLMSATLDYLPFGLPSENPLREKLLAAQDYLEERQTLVDNIESGNLSGIDLFRVDLNNLERCGTGNTVAQTVAAAFYAVTAYKTDFEQAVKLAINAGGEARTIGAITGALAGAYLGLSAIPERWLLSLPDYQQLIEAARLLHKTARSRELTDYVNAGI